MRNQPPRGFNFYIMKTITIKCTLFGDMTNEEIIDFLENVASKITCAQKEDEIDICDAKLIDDE